jgi:sulfur-carrier protein adenylyltransferase/sulfurtransferase
MKEVTAKELKELFDKKADFQLIDVREQHEFDDMNLKGELIPMGEVMEHTDRISKDKQVVIHCRSGKRSAAVIQALEQQLGFTNLYNLKGGILAYIEEVGL